MNAFCYSGLELDRINRLRERRRNAISNGEHGLYTQLTAEEAAYHGRAYQAWLDAKSGVPQFEANAASQGVSRAAASEPFAQPPDLSKPEAYSPEMPTAGPRTQAPWAGKAPEPKPYEQGPWSPAPKQGPYDLQPFVAPKPQPETMQPATRPVARRKVKQ